MKIPFTAGDVFADQVTTLDGIPFKLVFTYNQREDCYYLSVGDPSATDGSYLVSSIKLVTNKPLLRRWSGAASANGAIWPSGELVAYSTTTDDSIAGLGDLGSRVILVYITVDDSVWTTGQ